MNTALYTEQFDRLGESLVHNGGVTDGAYVLIHAHTGGEELAQAAAKHAWERGASEVDIFTFDHAELHKELTANPTATEFSFCEKETAAWQRAMDEGGVVIQLRSEPDPKLFDPLSEVYGRWRTAQWEARAGFWERGVMDGEFAWILIHIPTKEIAPYIYPELSPEEALEANWQAMFAMTLTDQPGHIERLTKNDRTLRRRAALMNELQIKTIHFSGPNTDLQVGLRRRADWHGGSKITYGKNSRRHTPNAPTYEVYTTPDWRTVSGTVAMTKDVVINGAVVSDGRLTIANGEVTEVQASNGKAALEELIAYDEGSKRIGEVALVGLDSPVAKQGRVFRANVPDENAACHIALGAAYLAGIDGGDVLTLEEQAAIGINKSAVHHDFMISDEHTKVTAITYSGEEIVLLENGHWTPDFL